MDDLIYILAVILIITVVIIVIITIIYFVNPSDLKPLLVDDINTCVNGCENQFQNCLQACDNLGPDCGDDVRLSCTIVESVCNRDCYPAIYTLRNGSVYTLYFYRIDGSLIGSLPGWSPNKLTVTASDYPVTACVCNPLNSCNCNNNSNGVVVNGAGCYIFWYFAGFYVTPEICHTG